MCERFELALWVCALVSMGVYFWDWFNEASLIGFIDNRFTKRATKERDFEAFESYSFVNKIICDRFKRLCTCLKPFYRFDSWRCEFIFRIYKSWSLASDEALLNQQQTLLSFVLKVVDLWVAGKFEVGTWENPIVMLNPRLTVSGSIKFHWCI